MPDVVAKLDPLEPPVLSQTAFNVPAEASSTHPVAGPTATAYTSTEGVDQLSYVCRQEGLHLVSIVLALITTSNAAVSHYVRPVMSYTVPTGNKEIVGFAWTEAPIGVEMVNQITDAASAAVANAYGLDAKGATPGATTAVSFPMLFNLGSTTTIRFGHTITGACTDGGTYRIGIAIEKL